MIELTKNDKVYLIIPAVIIAVISIISLQFPLLNLLGFEYSVVTAVFLSFISGFCTPLYLERGFQFSNVLKIQIAFFIIPLILGYLNSFLVKNCSMLDGLVFYFVFVGVSIIFGIAVGVLSYTMSKKYALLFFSVLWILIFCWSLVVYYVNPQLFLYNPIYGFFPGFVFDENITLSRTILIYRASIFIISILIIFTCFQKIKERIKIARSLFILSLLNIIAMIIFADDLGFSTSLSKLEAKFIKHETNPKFELNFESDSVTNVEKQIFQLTAEYHFNSLGEFFRIQPKKKIKIFLFETDKSKKEFLGTASADFTKPWQYVIFITKENFNDVIKHELAHIFCGEYSKNIFHVAHNFNLGLIEGAAMAAEWEWNDREPHFYAANIYKFIGGFDPTLFFQGFNFAFRPSTMSYIISGSFIRFIFDEFGIKKFPQLYATGNFKNTYGLTLEEIAQKYVEFIKTIQTNHADSLSTLYYFNRQSMFEKECLRAITKETKKSISLLTSKKYEEAEDYFLKLWKKVKSPSIAYGILYSKLYQKKYSECIDYFESEIVKNSFDVSLISSYLISSYAYALKGQVEEADSLLEFAEELRLNDEYINSIRFRKKIIPHKEIVEKFLFDEDRQSMIDNLVKLFKNDDVISNQFHEKLKHHDKVNFLKKYRNNFWVFEKEFYNSIKVSDFILASFILTVLQKVELTSIEKSKLLLMNYIYFKLSDYKSE